MLGEVLLLQLVRYRTRGFCRGYQAPRAMDAGHPFFVCVGGEAQEICENV